MDDPTLLIEDMLLELNNVSNFLAGLMFDPSIPQHVIDAISARGNTLDEKIEEFTTMLENA